MRKSQHINKIATVAVSFALLTCVWTVYTPKAQELSDAPTYKKKLFHEEIAAIDIKVNNSDWQNLMTHASEKEWIIADVVINGETFNGVGIRTKGNSTITQTAKSESEKYSLNIKFNKFVKGQTYYGLDAFCLNNMIDDATCVKEYIALDVMRHIGVPAPLTNYAAVTVNGEYYGLLLMLETYSESYLNRVFATTAGQLYNVKKSEKEKNGNDHSGGSLLYVGHEKNAYSSIFDNAVFNNKSSKHEERIIAAIENLNAGTDIEKYWDVDEILRYFAAHTAVVNLKSYVSDQQQNYYLYVRGGHVTILPWNYRSAFGGYPKSMTDATFVVNFPIDTPVFGVKMEDRPLLDKLLAVPEYKERYHKYLHQIVEEYFDSGVFEKTVNSLNSKIGDYVKKDVSELNVYEQYADSLPNLIELGLLRAKSIAGQLNGTIPSTTSGQIAHAASLIDASRVNFAGSLA